MTQDSGEPYPTSMTTEQAAGRPGDDPNITAGGEDGNPESHLGAFIDDPAAAAASDANTAASEGDLPEDDNAPG